MKNSDCGKCGKCCEGIYLPFSMKEIKERLLDQRDGRFVAENFEQISFEEMSKINPYFASKAKTQYRSSSELNYFKCNVFDHKTRRCGDYENRPDFCRNYPFYPYSSDWLEIKGEPKFRPGFVLYSEKCAFQKAMATTEEVEEEEKRILRELTKELPKESKLGLI